MKVEPPIELPFFIWTNEQFLQRGLFVPRPPKNRDFMSETSLLLEPDTSICVQVDLLARVQTMESTGLNLQTAHALSEQARSLPPESLAWVDLEQTYLDMLAYKARKGLTNIIIRPQTLPQIIEQVPCTFIADRRIFAPQSFTERRLLQQAITQLFCRYVDRFYQVRREQWDEQTLVYQPLDRDDPNLGFKPRSVSEEKAG